MHACMPHGAHASAETSYKSGPADSIEPFRFKLSRPKLVDDDRLQKQEFDKKKIILEQED
jgi:hypothetical protein